MVFLLIIHISETNWKGDKLFPSYETDRATGYLENQYSTENFLHCERTEVLQSVIYFKNGRNPRVQMVEEEYDGEEEVIYEDAESGEQLYMDDDGSLVEYVDQPQRKKKNIFSRITM